MPTIRSDEANCITCTFRSHVEVTQLDLVRRDRTPYVTLRCVSGHVTVMSEYVSSRSVRLTSFADPRRGLSSLAGQFIWSLVDCFILCGYLLVCVHVCLTDWLTLCGRLLVCVRVCLTYWLTVCGRLLVCLHICLVDRLTVCGHLLVCVHVCLVDRLTVCGHLLVCVHVCLVDLLTFCGHLSG